MEGRRVFVLDTTAMLSAQFEPGPAEVVTVQEVVDEVLYGGLAPQRISTALSTQAIKLKRPSKSSLEKVRQTARETGDLPRLSKADLNLLAAAYDELVGGRDVVVVSDDYSLQNTALRLGLKVMGVGRNVVREVREWIYRCLVCGITYSTPLTRCVVCGGETDRVVKKT
ncbi:MAG: NOB1 family endonuclease [Candidatus Caldarchaeum sp.]|nr:NOB1 family endonuclease [Candidatus Caldarchaeum sp.]MCX8200657.1 NOB1 family endonuclease [Candidatus Caldarchaeum sp.]MDW8063521.1 NOB1 family endonuclease [Candidatus Caldarchaeum sp.]MDW8436136.1 NOB1 family endonuclease [Candidatus Caldarchaeum sp.]